jgi:hypothetical protein
LPASEQYKVAKHFAVEISEHTFTLARKSDGIAAEAVLDGVYIICTSVPAAQMDAPSCVRNYKALGQRRGPQNKWRIRLP